MKASVKADANTPRPGTSTGLLEKLLRWLLRFRLVANFLQPRHPASQFTVERRVKDGADEAGDVATVIENAIGNPTVEKTIAIPITAVKVDPGALIALDQERTDDTGRALSSLLLGGQHDGHSNILLCRRVATIMGPIAPGYAPDSDQIRGHHNRSAMGQ